MTYKPFQDKKLITDPVELRLAIERQAMSHEEMLVRKALAGKNEEKIAKAMNLDRGIGK